MAVPFAQGYFALAQALAYPAVDLLAALQAGIAALPEGGAREHYAAFVAAAGRMSLGQWEELHTRTLDLNPLVAPYIGYQIWGESYRRGPFLGLLNRAFGEAGVSAEGELPDHLAPVLCYLAGATAPPDALAEVFDPAIDRMVARLREAEPDNPYLDLFLAIQALCASRQKKETTS